MKAKSLLDRTGILPRMVMAVTLFGVGFALVYSDALGRWDQWLYDWAVSHGTSPASEPITLVTVDRRSLDELGQWPWSRRIHAQVVHQLSDAGASVIALDFLFAEPDRIDPAGDEILAQAMWRSRRVVLPMTAEPWNGHRALVETLPLGRLRGAAAALGHVDVEVDTDGITRRLFLKSGVGEPRWSALPLAMLEVAEPERARHLPGQRNPQRDHASPDAWVRDYEVLIPFNPTLQPFPRFSYVDVLRGKVAAEHFRGRYVLIGATASGLGDTLAVPNDALRRGIFGVELNAQALAALLQGASIRPLAKSWQGFLTLLFALLPTLVYPFVAARWTPLVTVTLLGFALATALFLLYVLRIWFPAAAALFVVVLSYPLWSWQQLAYAVGYLRRELQRLLPATPPSWTPARSFTVTLGFLASMLGARGAWLYDGQRKVIARWGAEPVLRQTSPSPGVWTRDGESLWIAWQSGHERLYLGLILAEEPPFNAAAKALADAFLQRVANARALRRIHYGSLTSIRSRLQQVEQTAAHLQTAQRLIGDSLSQLAGGVVIADPLGEVLFLNKQAQAYLFQDAKTRPRESGLIELLAGLTPVGQQQGWQQAVSEALLQRKTSQLSAVAHGRDLWVQIAPYAVDGGLPAGVLLSLVDVTAVRQAEQKAVARIVLEQKEQALATLRSIADAVLTTDSQGIVASVNPAGERLLACTAEQLRGMPLAEAVRVFHEQGGEPVIWPVQQYLVSDHNLRLSGDIVLLDHQHQVHDVRISLAPIRGQDLPSRGLVLAISDISELRRMARTLEYQASHDGLTGLPNRVLLRDRLDHAIAQARRFGGKIAVLFIDLDRFKHINDGLGHDAGDALLVATAERLRRLGREQDTTARLGGDEFVMMLENFDRDELVAGVTSKILQAFAAPLPVFGQDITVSPSIGVSVFPRDGEDAETLLRNADRAMYRAKKEGGNMVMFYAEDMNIRAMERLVLERNLRQAIHRGELQVHYQPQLDLRSGTLVGAEALLRWPHPEFGAISPELFIPLAEETGLIFPLSEWLMETVCTDMKAWSLPEEDPFRVSVNLSARQFAQGEVCDVLIHVLRDTGLQGRRLGIEITESTIMRDVDGVAHTLQQLKALGVELAVDDFGTGYSSLAYLKRFPIDRLKIDKSFVQDITRNADDAAIASAVIAMAHSMGRRVIAEGVETLPQLQFLRAQGCDEVQGYYFSPAIPAQEMPSLFGRALDTVIA